jgi:cell wall integrity and stress response component
MAPSSSVPAPAPSSQSSADTTSSSFSSNDPSSSSTPSRTVYTSIITRSGSVVTQTVTTTPVVINGGDSPASAESPRRSLSSGAIAGIVLGVLLGLAAVALAAFLLWRRKKNQDAEGQGGSSKPKRTTSVLSRTGLLSRGRPPSMAENHYDNDPYTSSNIRNSTILGAGATVEPSSPLGTSQDNISSRRHSRPLVYDQRLNPSALFANQEANSSRVSIQDQQDYSRPLGIANPDFRASFDSR